MKTKNENEKISRSTVPFPTELWEKIKLSAIKNRRSANDEVKYIISEYFDGSFVRLDSIVKKLLETFAENKGYTLAEAANYLIPIGAKQETIDFPNTVINESAAEGEPEQELGEKTAVSQ